MSLIKQPNEIIVEKTLKCLIYGQAGTGKSTLALSAPKPLLLDFDGGAKRLNAEHKVPTVQIHDWKEVSEVLKEDLSPFETIVVDTVGKMIDFIISDVCGLNNPRIQDWGKINVEFSQFCRKLNELKKNIIFVAHRDNRKEGDNNVFIPAIREKNYNTIVTELDLMGYIESKNGQRVITFDFSDRNDGKNTCNLPQFIQIPTIVDAKGKVIADNNFFEKGIMKGFSDRLSAQVKLTEDYQAECKNIDEMLDMCEDAEGVNMFMEKVMLSKDYKHILSSKMYAKAGLLKKVKELGLSYNKVSSKYE